MDFWKLLQIWIVVSVCGTAAVAYCLHCWTKGESDD